MSAVGPKLFDDVDPCVDLVLDQVGKQVVLGLPLGLGKPNPFVNAIYQRAKEDQELQLTICTALSLERPAWSSDLERRFLEPFVDRMFSGYVDLDYATDMRKQALPKNVVIKEFYCKAGANLGVSHAQQNYVSSNYTHVYRDLLDQGVNVLAQMVCKREENGQTKYSLSSNPDVTLDVARELWRRHEDDGTPFALVGLVNQNMPYMYGDAVVDPSVFTMVIDDPQYNFRLFGAPKMAITTTDFAIGMTASSLIRDEGTLQIGIGSLGDALVYGLCLRQQKNGLYKKALVSMDLKHRFPDIIDELGGSDPFDKGLNGSTEMLVDGYLELMEAGVVKRHTYDDVTIQRLLNQGAISETVSPATLQALLDAGAIPAQLGDQDVQWLVQFGILKKACRLEKGKLVLDSHAIEADLSNAQNLQQVSKLCLGQKLKGGILIHGGFFLGPENFYDRLRDMPEDKRRQIFMTSVLNVNQLYENHYASQELKSLQRLNGRFVNACLMVTLNGGVCSDGLDTGQMVSGVGGQYNFVSQAHALPGARSILLCKSTRTQGREVHSNIVYNYGYLTIPRHLRDIIITEYGIADLRGKSDAEIIASLINITDSRFQDELLQTAKEAGKIDVEYEIPGLYRNNTPQRLEEALAPFRQQGEFDPFPFGCDFTAEELTLGKALKGLKAKMSAGLSKVSGLGRAITTKIPPEALPYLTRMNLDEPASAKERMMRKLVVYALKLSGALGPKPESVDEGGKS